MINNKNICLRGFAVRCWDANPRKRLLFWRVACVWKENLSILQRSMDVSYVSVHRHTHWPPAGNASDWSPKVKGQFYPHGSSVLKCNANCGIHLLNFSKFSYFIDFKQTNCSCSIMGMRKRCCFYIYLTSWGRSIQKGAHLFMFQGQPIAPFLASPFSILAYTDRRKR